MTMSWSDIEESESRKESVRGSRGGGEGPRETRQ